MRKTLYPKTSRQVVIPLAGCKSWVRCDRENSHAGITMAGAKESWHLLSNVNQGRSFILIAGLLWSLAGIFIKSLALPAVVIVFYRSLFASLFFLLFLRKRKWKVSFPIVISVTSYTAAISLFVLSNKLTTAANAIVLQYTAPIFVFLFIRFLFREPISRGNLVTLLLAMVGVAIIFSGSIGGQDQWGYRWPS